MKPDWIKSGAWRPLAGFSKWYNLSLHLYWFFVFFCLLIHQATEDVPLRCVCCSWCCESGRWQTPPITRLFHNTRVAPHHCRRDEKQHHDAAEGLDARIVFNMDVNLFCADFMVSPSFHNINFTPPFHDLDTCQFTQMLAPHTFKIKSRRDLHSDQWRILYTLVIKL